MHMAGFDPIGFEKFPLKKMRDQEEGNESGRFSNIILSTHPPTALRIEKSS